MLEELEMRGAASKVGSLEEVIPETSVVSVQVHGVGGRDPEPRALRLTRCPLGGPRRVHSDTHSVFLEGLASHMYLPLPSASSHSHPNPGGKGWTEKRVQRKPSVQTASRWHLSASSLQTRFPWGDLPVLKTRRCSIHAASPNRSCVLLVTLLKPQDLRG